MADMMNPMAQEPADQQAGYSIEILVNPDGTFNVSSEPLAEPEEQAEADKGERVESIGEALKKALEIYKAGGTQEEDDFQAGFGSDDTQKPISTMPKGGYAE